VFLIASAVNCVVQIAWFWRFRERDITMDGINYIGLARHLLDGNLKASVHGYWSPLITWIIAAGGLVSRNFILVGRIITISSFLLCLPLLYLLTLRLWRSRVAAALAVFWFSCARGLISAAVGMIIADFLLAACILFYFILLLGALRRNSVRSWMQLGGAHALAFLAKAISLPWLSIPSAIAALLRNRRNPRRLLASLVLVFLLPTLVWIGWGCALRAKYGVFTSGYQLRANLMINWHRRLAQRTSGDSLSYRNFPSLYDSYMVAESWPSSQNFSLAQPALLSMIVETEMRNLPAAVKETIILLTPAGVLGLAVMLVLLIRDRDRYRAETAFACIAVIGTVALIGAYCMLVFDGRYLIPITPVLIAVVCPLLLPARLAPTTPHLKPAWQRLGAGLLAASLVFLALYWSSPFRTVDRDFEVSCYQAADALRQFASTGTLVSIGEGPYPEHGVGFEVGPYVAYFSRWRLIGGNEALPPVSAAEGLRNQVLATHANAVAVWGSPSNPTYSNLIAHLKLTAGLTSFRPFSDPYKGEVGTVFLFSAPNR
jgi:4-amino-4-deoxy-L-arabinose transferase-like glycosyltransferase